MAEKMPERIWAVKDRKYGGVWWQSQGDADDEVEFIRADLVDEAVKALEHARESLEIFADCVSDHTQIRQDISDDLAKIDAALTRIKGDVT